MATSASNLRILGWIPLFSIDLYIYGQSRNFQQMQGWLGVYHYCCNHPLPQSPSSVPKAEVKNTLIVPALSVSLFMRWPSSSCNRLMLRLVLQSFFCLHILNTLFVLSYSTSQLQLSVMFGCIDFFHAVANSSSVARLITWCYFQCPYIFLFCQSLRRKFLLSQSRHLSYFKWLLIFGITSCPLRRWLLKSNQYR